MTLPKTAQDSFVRIALKEAQTALQAMIENQTTIDAIEAAGALLAATFTAGGRVFSAGNGGSMCDAMHFAEELSGRYRDNRAPLAALSISDPSHLSCVSNDFGYEHVFSRYLEAHGRAGDVFVGLSTSGKSKNILNAAAMAKRKGMKIIGLTGGKPGCLLAQASDITIATPGGAYADRVQEMHIKAIHIMMELVERELFPENYRAENSRAG